MASTYLEKTFGSSGNRKTFTISTWLKRNQLGGGQSIFYGDPSGLTNGEQDDFYFGNDSLLFGGWNSVYITSTAKFRDVSAWYHIVLSVDTTQATSSNRIKLYVNGVEQARSEGTGYPAQNFDTAFIKAGTFRIAGNSGASGYGNYTLSHFHFVDGTAYDATAFGEYDANGVWKPILEPSVTYGTNGFFILKDGNSVTDQSPNTNNFTVGGGTLTKTEDSPSNVFCTANPLARYSGNLNYSNGNTTTTGSANDWTMGSSTMGASTGKWYYEYKLITAGTGNGYFKLGFISDQAFANNTGHIAESALDGGYAFYCQNGNLEVRTDGAVISGYSISDLGISFSMGDIMCVAVDMDNKKAYFRKNDGAWIKSANPATGTNGLDISADYTAGKAMIPAFAIYYPGVANVNFGNGYFGTTAVASAGTNASGNGIFEFDVPTGYTALSTKGLNL